MPREGKNSPRSGQDEDIHSDAGVGSSESAPTSSKSPKDAIPKLTIKPDEGVGKPPRPRSEWLAPAIIVGMATLIVTIVGVGIQLVVTTSGTPPLIAPIALEPSNDLASSSSETATSTTTHTSSPCTDTAQTPLESDLQALLGACLQPHSRLSQVALEHAIALNTLPFGQLEAIKPNIFLSCQREYGAESCMYLRTMSFCETVQWFAQYVPLDAGDKLPESLASDLLASSLSQITHYAIQTQHNARYRYYVVALGRCNNE